MDPEEIKKQKELTTLVYALHALSFFIGISLLVAVVINYVKLDDVKGTYLESHFRSQIRTFWTVFFVGLLGLLTAFIFIGFAILLALGIWFVIRTVKGWLALNDGKAIS